nr:MAG TPA: hypothetical protein [Caudoviricetes sp.]
MYFSNVPELFAIYHKYRNFVANGLSGSQTYKFTFSILKTLLPRLNHCYAN